MVKVISFRTLSNVFDGTFFRYPFHIWPLTVVTTSSIIDCGLGPKCTYVCTFWLEFNFCKMGVNIRVKIYWFTVTQKTRLLNRGVATGLIRGKMPPPPLQFPKAKKFQFQASGILFYCRVIASRWTFWKGPILNTGPSEKFFIADHPKEDRNKREFKR